MDINEQLFGDYQPPSALEKAAQALRGVGHKMSLLPFLGIVSAVTTAAAAALETVDGFMNKGIKTGTKNMVSGIADTAVTSASSAIRLSQEWWLYPTNVAAALFTGDTLGELARKGTKGVLDAVVADSKTPKDLAREMQVLGTNPMTRGAVPAGVGFAPGMQPQMAVTTAPRNPHTGEVMPQNFWADKEAQRRGQSPEEARANFMRNNHEEAAALRQAAAQDAQLGA